VKDYLLATDAAKKNDEFRFAAKSAGRYTRRSVPIEESEKLATLGILKIGANITYSGTANRTAANFDVTSVCDALRPNFRLHFITKITRNTMLPKTAMYTDVQEVKDRINDLGIDALLIFNGAVNHWGGEPDANAIEIWRFIQSFQGRVFYLHTDGAMRLHQVYDKTFENRGWTKRWPKDEIFVDRNDIVYLTQARSVKHIESLINKTHGIKIRPENIIYFPIQEAGLLKRYKFKKPREIKYDLIYGGGLRSGRRRDQIVQWFFGHTELKVKVFGNISAQKCQVPLDSPMPEFGPPVASSMFISEMRRGLATVQIVDSWYENHWVTLRFYEALQAGVIPFVDHRADRRRVLYYPGSVIEDFLYVKNQKDLVEKIQLIKREDCANEVLELCRDAIRLRWDANRYRDLLRESILKRI
jgi:hypothetical protein